MPTARFFKGSLHWTSRLTMALALAIPLTQAAPALSDENVPIFSPLPAEPSAPEATEPDTLTEEAVEEAIEGINPAEPSSSIETEITDSRSRVPIALPALLQLVVQQNRDLRDRQLERLIEKQQLQEAEARFDPRFTPEVGVDLSQQFDSGFGGSGGLGRTILGTSSTLSDRTTLNRSAGVLGEVLTRQGTEIGLTLDAWGDTPISLRVTQPLLRGAGNAINEAPVTVARLQESQNFYTLQQTLIETVSTTVTQYTSLIQAQESVDIQQQALDRRRERLTILSALVDAGRRARVDLVDAQRSIADAQRDLLLAQTQLDQANTALLDQIGTDQAILFVASPEVVAELFADAVTRIDAYNVETLVAIAYQRRPDYLQTELDQDVAQLNQRLAEDDLRWQLNIEGDASLGDFSETTVGVVARRTFDEPELETARVRSDVEILQGQNRLLQQQIAIRNEITNQLNTVQVNLARVEAARRATDNARLQLEVAQELFDRGRSGASIFQIINREETLVDAQNSELDARIQFLNSIVELDQAVSLTLEIWSREVDLLPALLTPDSVTEVQVEPSDIEFSDD